MKATHSDVEKTLASAQFSINVIDLIHPPVPLGLGKVNTRRLVDKEAKNLKEAMTMQGMKPFSIENMIPIMIERRHVDEKCIWTGINAYKAPTLQLSDAGSAELRELELAGGRHRIEAVKSIRAARNKALDAVKKKTVTEQQKKRPTTAKGQKDRAKRVEKLLAEEAAIKAEIAEVSRWGIVLYDKGKSLMEYSSRKLICLNSEAEE